MTDAQAAREVAIIFVRKMGAKEAVASIRDAAADHTIGSSTHGFWMAVVAYIQEQHLREAHSLPYVVNG